MLGRGVGRQSLALIYLKAPFNYFCIFQKQIERSCARRNNMRAYGIFHTQPFDTLTPQVLYTSRMNFEKFKVYESR